MVRRTAVPWVLLLLVALPPADTQGAQKGSQDPCVPLTSITLGPRTARYALKHIQAINDIYSSEFLILNNSWMKLMENEFRKKGIDTSLVQSESWWVSHLGIAADPKSPNPAARLYGRLAARLGARTVTASIISTVSSQGFFFPADLRVDIGPWATLDMLEGKKHHIALHEFRHLMFDHRRRRGIHSVFDLEFKVSGKPRLDANGNSIGEDFYESYPSHIPLEEIYISASDALFLARHLRTSELVLRGSTANELDQVLLSIENVAQDTEAILSNVLMHFDEAHRQAQWDNGTLIVPTTTPTTRQGMKVSVAVPARLASPAGQESSQDALLRFLYESRRLNSNILEHVTRARSIRISAKQKQRAVRELWRMVRRADRRTMVGP